MFDYLEMKIRITEKIFEINNNPNLLQNRIGGTKQITLSKNFIK